MTVKKNANRLESWHCTLTFLIINLIYHFLFRKKDQCRKCVSYQNAEIEKKKQLQQEYDSHETEKKLSRLEKEDDKSKINNLYQVACVDLQSVLPVPRGDVSSFYYKSCLSTYNFTISELQKKRKW